MPASSGWRSRPRACGWPRSSAAGAAFSALILERLPAEERERAVETIARVAQVVESIPDCITCS
jgi:mevalonate pyrophosphate decarboxylase